MRQKLDVHYITYLNSKSRAIGGVIILIIVLIGIPFLISLNYFDYFNKTIPLFFYLGFVFGLYVAVRWIPSICLSLNSTNFIIKNEAGGISVSGRNDNFSGYGFFPYVEICEVSIEKTLLRQDVVLELADNSRIRVPVLFASYVGQCDNP